MDRILPSPHLLRELLHYDDATGKLFWKERPVSMFRPSKIKKGERSAEWAASVWNRKFAGREAFTATRPDGYRVGSVNCVLLRAHRVIWAMVHGAWPENDIDHINGDRADNRVENLRDVTNIQNHRNARMSVKNTSGVNGVTFDRQTGKWRAGVKVNFKHIALGRYSSKEEAAAARASANKRYGFTDRHGAP